MHHVPKPTEKLVLMLVCLQELVITYSNINMLRSYCESLNRTRALSTPVPGTSEASIARASAPATPPPVITSTRRTAAAFGSSLMSSVDTSRTPNQEIRIAQRPAESRAQPGCRLGHSGMSRGQVMSQSCAL